MTNCCYIFPVQQGGKGAANIQIFSIKLYAEYSWWTKFTPKRRNIDTTQTGARRLLWGSLSLTEASHLKREKSFVVTHSVRWHHHPLYSAMAFFISLSTNISVEKVPWMEISTVVNTVSLFKSSGSRSWFSSRFSRMGCATAGMTQSTYICRKSVMTLGWGKV